MSHESSAVIGKEMRLPPVPPMVFVREDGRIVGMNQVAEDYFGCSIGQVGGLLLGEVLMEAGSLGLLNEALSGFGRGERVELLERPRAAKVKRADGTFCAILLSMSVVNLREGKQLSFAFHPADSTPGQSRLLRRLIDAIPDNLYIKDAESRIVINNAAHAERLGTVPEECVGKTDLDFHSPEQAKKFMAAEQALIKEGTVYQKEEESIDRLGKKRWTRTTKVPLKDEGGHIIGLAGINHDITAMKAGQEEREKLNQQLVDLSRQAGMAEVATGVLHNVGNVLNSVNIAAGVLNDRIRNLPVKNLARAVDLMKQHEEDLGSFISSHPQGTKLPGYLATVSSAFQKEEGVLLEELATLAKNIEHIKEIVTVQQSYAKSTGVLEVVDLSILLEQTVQMGVPEKDRQQVSVSCEARKPLMVKTDKHVVLQVLTNLVKNAQQAVQENPEGGRQIAIRAEQAAEGMVKVEVQDNGVGIGAENLTKIFGHGFSTKKNGHGFGLHSSANAAKRLGGSLEARSAGVGMGATFVLMLPMGSGVRENR